MNFAHLHLLLNHFPIIGTMIGVGIFLVSFVGKNEDLRRAGLIIFVAMALLTLPTFFSGVGAQDMLSKDPALTALMLRHEGSAMLSLWFMVATGALSLIGLWQSQEDSRPATWNVLAVLVFSLLTVGLMARTGNTGGEIRHPEVRDYQGPIATEGTAGSIIHMFEPTPEKFTQAMVNNKWWWAFMMDVHFIGLALIIGTIGILDLRIMGFFKQLPFAPLHRFLPWAMVGFSFNLVTGLLAFIGMPGFYTFDAVFWMKIAALMLLGVNLAAFYLTNVFGRIEHLGAGEDAPMSAKLVAVSSLVLWFAVVCLGRYIQVYIATLPSSNG